MNNKIKEFTDLEAWKHGHEFALEIYKVTKNFPKCEIYGIVSQLRRAATSITSNIAEGFSRFSFKDKIRFYYNSRGSIRECQNQIHLSRDEGYINQTSAKNILSKADETRRDLNGLIRSTESQLK